MNAGKADVKGGCPWRSMGLQVFSGSCRIHVGLIQGWWLSHRALVPRLSWLLEDGLCLKAEYVHSCVSFFIIVCLKHCAAMHRCDLEERKYLSAWLAIANFG